MGSNSNALAGDEEEDDRVASENFSLLDMVDG